ncbi:10029_t:CDS:2 [Ambispora gerdemannii]|uniref:10029_t:CDS:1 n=1 Tax=Ambispora gerdemannii TaxID=144530 RepID=A0A9N9E5R9_9GLOM|nr:10029_t:CDS:2 [Ambispora gerdemannii]
MRLYPSANKRGTTDFPSSFKRNFLLLEFELLLVKLIDDYGCESEVSSSDTSIRFLRAMFFVSRRGLAGGAEISRSRLLIIHSSGLQSFDLRLETQREPEETSPFLNETTNLLKENKNEQVFKKFTDGQLYYWMHRRKY